MAYFLLGHGSEDIESERQEMPEDTVLITISECGVSVKDADLYLILDEINKTPELAKTPEKFPEDIRKRLRIYTQGMEYPTLYLSPFLDFDSKYKPNTKLIEKSGVYSIPLSFEDTMVGEATTKYGMFVDDSNSVIEKAYEGSLIGPSLPDIKKTYGNDLPISLLSEEIPISSIFSKVGKGIYYFPVCRNVKLPNELVDLFNTIPKSVNTLDSLEVANYMIDHVSDEKLKRELRRRIFTIKNTRSRSELRQRPKAGKRKFTRKLHRKLKKRLFK